MVFKNLYYLHCFELWHGNGEEEEDAEGMKNTQKVAWSSSSGDGIQQEAGVSGAGLDLEHHLKHHLDIHSQKQIYLMNSGHKSQESSPKHFSTSSCYKG